VINETDWNASSSGDRAGSSQSRSCRTKSLACSSPVHPPLKCGSAGDFNDYNAQYDADGLRKTGSDDLSVNKRAVFRSDLGHVNG
jgi:hypothetical protein